MSLLGPEDLSPIESTKGANHLKTDFNFEAETKIIFLRGKNKQLSPWVWAEAFFEHKQWPQDREALEEPAKHMQSVVSG